MLRRSPWPPDDRRRRPRFPYKGAGPLLALAADATLVHLAKREGLVTIFTVDHDDFETYRIEGKRRFRIVPDR
jgi:hypothetical protein